MSARARMFVAWFSVGVLLPPAAYAFATLLNSLGADQAGRIVGLVALGGCPFWLFLWIPAMAHPDDSILFYLAVAAVLITNGCLYLLMAQLQSKTQGWRRAARLATLSIAYPVLMALGYSLPLAFEAV